MASADGRLWLVYNGEIYNYLELREQLEKAGFRFRTSTDTEVLLAAYQHWGTDALQRFVGMFAFAIYDIERHELFLARDFFGIKPLYYARWNGHFAFASEIKPLLELPGSQRTANPAQLYQYLRFGITDAAQETLFGGVYELPAAHYMLIRLVSDAAPAATRYWQIDPTRTADLSEHDGAAKVKDLLEQSVKLHLRSDVPLGTCLSGGLDSTAILMLMARHVPNPKEIQSFSFITDHPIWGEARFVEIASKAAGIRSHEVRPSPAELSDDLGDLLRTQELPFAGTSIYAQYRVFKLASHNGMKVMLDGQGSDEIFAGYPSFLGARAAGLLAAGHPLAAVQVLKGMPANMRPLLVRNALQAGGRLLPGFMVPAFRRLAGEPFWPTWLNRQWFEQRGITPRERPLGRGRAALREELIASLSYFSLPQLLRYEDRNSMRFSIESRVPFCVPALAELAYSLPEQFLVSPNGTTKAVLKKSLRQLVPDAIIDREKVGFATPESDWMLALNGSISRVLDGKEGPTEFPFLFKPDQVFTLQGRSHCKWQTHAWRIYNTCAWARCFSVRMPS